MRWLIEEMLPSATATELNGLGHDASSVIADPADPASPSGGSPSERKGSIPWES